MSWGRCKTGLRGSFLLLQGAANGPASNCGNSGSNCLFGQKLSLKGEDTELKEALRHLVLHRSRDSLAQAPAQPEVSLQRGAQRCEQQFWARVTIVNSEQRPHTAGATVGT